MHFASLMHPTVILHARDPRRGLIVVAASDAATAAGVRRGMPLAEAMTLIRSQESGARSQESGARSQESGARSQESGARSQIVPSSKFQVQGSETLNLEPGTLNCIAHDPAADLAELARLAEHCERFSPLVGWNTAEAELRNADCGLRNQNSAPTPHSALRIPHSPDCLFLDITGIGVLFGGEEQLAREAAADLARLGYTARAAVADTIGAAWAKAKYEVRSDKYEDPDFVLRPSSFVLPVAALRLPQETLDLLAQLGITRLEELLALPRASLRARFGERLLLRLDQLTGAAQEVIVPYRPPPKFAAEWVLEYPAERRDVVEQIVRELVLRVAAALAERREGVVRLACRLDCGRTELHSVQDGFEIRPTSPDGMQFRPTPTRIDVGLFRPSADARHLWDLVRMQLEQLALPGPVGRVTLQALTTAPLENRQGELFAGGQDEADRQRALLIDRLTSRLGPDAVLRPELTADPLPERAAALRRTKYEVIRTKKSKARAKSPSSSLVLRPSSFAFRPLFLRPPLELDVVSVVPDGPPVTFRYGGKLHRVAWHWGPERIETGWYRGASVRRDYYRVQTDEGLRFWLFRRLDDEKWCLHGEFS